MTDWRAFILKHFQSSSHRLTLVADPDGLMLEERLLARIHTNGFQLLRFDDPVQFRYAYESQFRQKWDRGEQTELVVVLRSSDHALDRLPYDLLEAGRQLKFQISDLFPKLSYPIVSELDRSDLDALYAAYQTYQGPELGDDGTRAYILTHVFAVSLDTIKTPADVLKYLLARHYAGQRVPETIDRLLLTRFLQIPQVAEWHLENLLRDRFAFFAFVQHAWPRFLDEQPAARAEIHEARFPYAADAPQLPLDQPGIRAYVDSLFLEGYLQPVPAPRDWSVENWTLVGILRQPEIERQERFQRLVKRIAPEVPGASSTHQEWLRFARTWSELFVLRYQLSPGSPLSNAVEYDVLAKDVEQRFSDWMLNRYLTLHNYSPLPSPVMLHHIPYYLASLLEPNGVNRIALVVLDGLAFNQWLLAKDELTQTSKEWAFRETGAFAWVPTVTSVSRQSIFAGRPPLSFPETWNTTRHERAHWKRFWSDAGLSDAASNYFLLEDFETDDPEMDVWVSDHRSRVAGIILKKVDNIMHGAELGMAGMQQQVALWVQRGDLARLLIKLARAGFTTFLTADHGNIMARGIGKPKQGALIDSYGRRALQFEHPAFLQQAQEQFPAAIPWRSDALPDDMHILLADDYNAFDSITAQVVTHGGITLEEVIVPFVRVTGVPQ